MGEVWIDGKPAELAAAIERAADILSKARLPVVAGLGSDVAGTRAAILLAEKLRGAYDHIHARRIFADLDVVRQAGLMITTPNEARLRADVYLFVGRDLSKIWPALITRLAPGEIPPFDLVHEPRKILWVAPGRGGGKIEGSTVQAIEFGDVRVTLASLRARVAGHAVNAPKATLRKLDEAAETLKGARFGVAIWGGDELDSLAVETLYGLIVDLNKTTRFTGLPLGSGANASGVVQTSGWMTGFPVRTAFGRGFPEHDTWRFDSTRLIESGEADAALWINAYGAETPPWKKTVPLVALTQKQASFARSPQVLIEIGQPGKDHDGAEFSLETTSIVGRFAEEKSELPSVADIIGEISKQIEGNASC